MSCIFHKCEQIKGAGEAGWEWIWSILIEGCLMWIQITDEQLMIVIIMMHCGYFVDVIVIDRPVNVAY